MEMGYGQEDMAKRLLLKPLSISQRFTCRVSWNLTEMYEVLDWLNLPHDQLHIYFPPGGIAPEKGGETACTS